MKILSIDFDYVVTEDICTNRGADATLDGGLYSKLLDIVRHHPKVDVLVADGHHQIVRLIRDVHHLKDVVLYNVDHHHDIVYKRSDRVNCGNWASRLIVSGEIGQYYWVPKPGSRPYTGSLPCKVATLDDVYTQQFDMMFICKSTPWIPVSLDNSFEYFVGTVRMYHNVAMTDEPGLKDRSHGI